MINRLLAALLVLITLIAGGRPLPATGDPAAMAYRCDGDPLSARLVLGAVDAPSSTAVPVGSSVLLEWRQLHLQLPRTNNAGAASFTDGKWWWSLENPDQPRFRLRQGLGAVQEFHCERLSATHGQGWALSRSL